MRGTARIGTLALGTVILAAPPRGRWEALDQALERSRRQLRIPGVAAAVVEDGQIVWRQSYGNLTSQSLVNVASITKTMGAVLAMQEIEAGRLRLDDGVPGLKGVRLRQVLSHTSAGRTFRYDNARYGLVRPLLERSAGRPVAVLMQERIFGPAGMTRTFPSRSVAGGVVSTAEDLARYAAALDGVKLVAERSKQLMWSPSRPALPYGYGWFVQSHEGRRIAWHYGRIDSSSSLIVKIPSLKLSLVVVANSPALGNAFRLANVALSPAGVQFLEASLREEMPESEMELAARDLLARMPYNPEAAYFVGSYYQRAHRPAEAVQAFARVRLSPPVQHWAAAASYVELARHYRHRDPARAKEYLKAAMAVPGAQAETLREARQMLGALLVKKAPVKRRTRAARH